MTLTTDQAKGAPIPPEWYERKEYASQPYLLKDNFDIDALLGEQDDTDRKLTIACKRYLYGPSTLEDFHERCHVIHPILDDAPLLRLVARRLAR